MREVLHLELDDARRTRWKNGRGETRELALWPAHARFERGDFEWRISRAQIVETGAFSSFAGYARVLVALSGGELELEHGPAAPRARLRKLEPYAFSGDWPTHATLRGEPIDDFNVLTRRGVCSAVVAALRLGARTAREALDARHVFIHVARGGANTRVTGEDDEFELATGDSLWIREPAPGDEFELRGTDGACELVVVRINAVRR